MLDSARPPATPWIVPARRRSTHQPRVLHILSWIGLAAARLRSHLGLSILSLLSVALAVGLVSAIPIFSQGVSAFMLWEELERLAHMAGRPIFCVRFYYTGYGQQALSLAQVRDLEPILAGIAASELELPTAQVVSEVETQALEIYPVIAGQRVVPADTTQRMEVTLHVLPQVEKHVVLLEGQPFDTSGSGNAVPLWAHVDLANEMGLQVGENYELVDPAAGRSIPAFIAGIWRPRDNDEPYWFDNPDSYLRHAFFVSAAAYEEQLQPALATRTGFDSWYIIFDERAMETNRADRYAYGLMRAANVVASRLPGARMDYSPLEPLQNYLRRKRLLSTLLLGFSLPTIGLLCYFISLVSTTTALCQREEVAILSSRGAPLRAIVGLAGLETLLLIALGTPPGMLLGYAMARLMSCSQSFLHLSHHTAFPATLAAVDGRLLIAALLVLAVTRLLPLWQSARTSITAHLQKRSRPVRSNPLRVVFDATLITATAYAYLHLKQRGTLSIIGWEPSGDPFRDPLLLLAPSLFIFTASLVAAHLFSLLMHPVDLLSMHMPHYVAHMGLRQLARQSGQYAGVLFLVILCLGQGAFYASLALTLDDWLRDRFYYQVGADCTLKLGPGLSSAAAPGSRVPVADAGPGEGGWLLPISEYVTVPGIQAATRVGDYVAFPKLATPTRKGRLLGVDRLDFPSVAYFRRDLAAQPLGELMNRLAMHNDGLLVPSQFLATHALVEGQQLVMDVAVDPGTFKPIGFVIVGAFDYFPTMYPEQAEVFVANLDYLFEQAGDIYPHSIWLRTDPKASMANIIEGVEQLGVEIAATADARLLIQQDEGRVERVGIFGLLSVAFLTGSVLSGTGLLVYTHASLQGRLQQFGVLRAIGLSTRGMLAMLSVEHASIIAYGVIGGISLGTVVSHLFAPFFQITSDPALALPPMRPEIAWTQILAVTLAFAGSLILCQLVILQRVTRRDIFQVLRLGQRE